jgi:hypothetical protein
MMDDFSMTFENIMTEEIEPHGYNIFLDASKIAEHSIEILHFGATKLKSAFGARDLKRWIA